MNNPGYVSLAVVLAVLETSAAADVITAGDVAPPGGAATRHHSWVVGGPLYVGNSGTGTLPAEADGEVSNTYGYIGRNSGSTGEANVIGSGSGSQWNNSFDLNVGYEGDGTLKVEGGGVVSANNNSYIGRYLVSTGMATVTGTGSKWNNSGYLFVGDAGNGN